MTDEIFFKRAKEAIVEHFNSHCKVGDLFEDEVKTREDFVCPIWCSMGKNFDIRRSLFCVESSKSRHVYYSVVGNPTEESLSIEVFKSIDTICKILSKKDAHSGMDMSICLDEEQKACESDYVYFFKYKGDKELENE